MNQDWDWLNDMAALTFFFLFLCCLVAFGFGVYWWVAA